MASEPSNSAKSKVRERHAIGLVDPPGTAANSNQMLLEAIGLHLPGAAFIHPHAPLREALTREAVATVLSIGAGAPRSGAAFTPIGRLVIDASAGSLTARVAESEWSAREVWTIVPGQSEINAHDLGLELFGGMRRNVQGAEQGAVTWL